MYSPDGFASLLCLMKDQCQFLSWQQPFVWLMQFFHGNLAAFFAMQTITWFALIISIYFLAKTLGLKHLFLTPFLLIFAGALFIDNYVGSFENDYIAIIFLIWAIIFYLKSGENKLNKYSSIILIETSIMWWMWPAYFNLPRFFEPIAEQNWWAQILAWGFITPIFLLCVVIAIWAIWNKKDDQHFAKMLLIAFCFPKLWFFAIPLMLKLIDTGLSEFDWKPNYTYWMSIIILAIMLGQCLRVGILTYEAWSFDTSKTNCFTVNHEYLARVQGKSLNYNQAPIYEYNACLKEEGLKNET